ncbi:MAG: argininosuccinate lyase, partial [Duodenibacillus sp.]|nr:argininosuccinate lyase [Duodenibacillus sp.]
MNISTCPWGYDQPRATSDKALAQTWAYWLARINRASLVMLSEEGIVDPAQAAVIARAQRAAERRLAEPGAPVIEDIMPLERMLIEECGQTATLIHTGRSRQDIFATLYQARLRRSVLDAYRALNGLRGTLLA